VNYYHRAIYGSWSEQRQANRTLARIELVNALGKAGKRQEAQSELLALEAEAPDDLTIQKQLGRLLLAYALPKESPEFFGRSWRRTSETRVRMTDSAKQRWRRTTTVAPNGPSKPPSA